MTQLTNLSTEDITRRLTALEKANRIALVEQKHSVLELLSDSSSSEVRFSDQKHHRLSLRSDGTESGLRLGDLNGQVRVVLAAQDAGAGLSFADNTAKSQLDL